MTSQAGTTSHISRPLALVDCMKRNGQDKVEGIIGSEKTELLYPLISCSLQGQL